MPIAPNEYMHPEDKTAYDHLRSIPLFPQCVQTFMKVLPERILHGRNMAQKVRLGRRQLPEIYKFLPVACKELGIEEPEMYLEMSPYPNAYTYGDKQPMITVTSGLVESLDDLELLTVIAHECGHIACHHTLYRTMASMLWTVGTRIFGPLAAVSMPVQLGLYHWMRRSELSADRAAAVVVKDSRPVVNCIIHMAGGPRSITKDIDVDLYVEQAAAYDKLMESQWDQLLQSFSTMGNTHPLLAVRTREILQWCNTEQFQKIVRGAPNTLPAEVISSSTATEPGPFCGACGQPVRESWRYCRKCGAEV